MFAIAVEDDLSSVYDAVRPLSVQWYGLGCSLGLSLWILDKIQHDANNNAELCLINCLHMWLAENFNYQKNGAPSWRRLVQEVDTRHHKLALMLSELHRGTILLYNHCIDKTNTELFLFILIVKRSTKNTTLRRGYECSDDFARLVRNLSPLFDRSVDIDELKGCYLRVFCDPKEPSCLYVSPEAYQDLASAGKVLVQECLVPKYVSCTNVYLLERLVNNFGCSSCKKLLTDYITKYGLVE